MKRRALQRFGITGLKPEGMGTKQILESRQYGIGNIRSVEFQAGRAVQEFDKAKGELGSVLKRMYALDDTGASVKKLNDELIDIISPATESIDSKIIAIAFKQIRNTLSNVGQYKTLFVYLIVYLLFNDGIQTVLSIAGAYGADTLGVDLIFNMATIVIVQFIAAPGSMLFNTFARIYSSKKSLMISLVGWIIIIFLAMGFAPLEDTGEYAIKDGLFSWWPKLIRTYLWEPFGLNVNFQWLILGTFVGIVMGGSQAIARSIFAVMTPVKQSAEFFSFLGFMSRGASIFGPLLYALVAGYLGARTAIFSVSIFLIAGTIGMQLLVDVEKGKKEALKVK